nr:hypothetical protein [Tanacetum cinerariifolium]
NFAAGVVGLKLVVQALGRVVEAVAEGGAVVLEYVVGRTRRDGAVAVVGGRELNLKHRLAAVFANVLVDSGVVG